MGASIALQMPWPLNGMELLRLFLEENLQQVSFFKSFTIKSKYCLHINKWFYVFAAYLRTFQMTQVITALGTSC